MGSPGGFDYEVCGDGSVIITHHGRKATVLRGSRAQEFLEAVRADPQAVRTDPQGVMARWTGNYRRGNERTARQHPRNQH